MEKGFGELYLLKFKDFWGMPATILSLILGFFLWIYSPDSSIQLMYALPLLLIIIVLVKPLVDLSFSLYHKASSTNLPSVLTVKNYNSDVILFLSESELFTHDSIVSIHIVEEEDFERLIGFGYVFNIQENGKIQIWIDSVLKDSDEIIENIKDKNATTLKNLVVRPTTPKRYLNLIN